MLNMPKFLRFAGLILIGLVVGLGLGLYLGWVAWPTEFTDAAPQILQEQYRRDYAQMIATTYALDGDLRSAERRVNSLASEANGRSYFFSVTLDTILRNEDEDAIRQMVRLAVDLGLQSPAFAPYSSTEGGNGP